MEIRREEVGVKVKSSSLDYYRNNWGMGGGREMGSSAAAFFSPMHTRRRTLKGIVQPFELGGVTRLIRSAVKFCMAGN